MTNPQQQQRVHHPPLLAGLVIRVGIRSGKNLVPKDRPHRRLLHGMKREAATTSDPYVLVRLQNQTYGHNQVHAKTPVIPKNCQNPEWDTTIVVDLPAHQARDVLQQICSSSSNGGNTTTATTAATTTSTPTMTAAEEFSRRMSQIQLGLPTIDCEIYDRDVLSFSDPMGIVQIPLTLDYFHRTDEAVDDDGKECRTTTNTVGPHWYMVGTEKFTSDSSGTRSTTFYANATGELHLTIQVEAQWMVRINEYLAHPQTTPRSILLSTPVAVELAWTTFTANTDHVVAMIDTACIAIDGRNGNIDMENCIFYHNLANPNGSIQQHSCTTTTKVTGTATTVFHTETYSITFASIPHNISMLFFGIFASQPEQYLTNDLLFSMTQRIMNRDTNKGICAYTTGRQPADIHTTSSTTTALIMAQLVRSPSDRNVWSVHLVPPTEDGGLLATFDSGRDFGTLMPELKQLVYDSQLIPNMVLHPNQHETRIGLMRKGGIIRWNDYMRQQEPYSEDVTTADHRAWKFAIQWENSNLNQFNQIRRMHEPTVEPMKYEMQALLFSGDDHTGLNFECVEQIHTNHPESNFDQSVQLGDKMLDQEEYMSVRLPKLPNYITCVAFMIHVGEVVNPCAVSHKILFQIRDPVTNQAIVKYQQAIPSTLPPYQSLLISCLYRTDTSLTPKAAIPSHENDYEWYFHVVDEIHLTSSHVASVRNVVDRLYSTLHHRNSPAVTTTADTEELAEPDIIL